MGCACLITTMEEIVNWVGLVRVTFDTEDDMKVGDIWNEWLCWLDHRNGGNSFKFNLHTTQALRSKSPTPLGSTRKDVVTLAGAE